MDFGPKHRKKIWYTAVVGGLAGASGLAAVAVVSNAASPSLRSEVPAASGAQAVRQVADKDPKGGKDGKDDYGYDNDGVEVPCDADDLIQAIIHANGNGGGTLKLTEHCTYTLTSESDGNGLPPIEQPITIKGNGATIARSAGGSIPRFRIFQVVVGGDLTLKDVSVKYGFADGILGGGGLLVRAGGRATLVDTTFNRNLSETVGGAIANYGITKIVGAGHDGKDGDDWSKDGKSRSDSKDGSDRESSEDYGDNHSDMKVDGASYSDISDNYAQAPILGGGGVFNARSLKMDNTRLSYNGAVGRSADGGAVVNTLGGVAELSKVSLDHNRSTDDGGGLGASLGATTTVDYSRVANNTSGDDAGGIRNSTLAALYLQGSSVEKNSADDDGGGINNTLGAKLVSDNSEINDNTARDNGGGLRNSFFADAVLRHTEVDLNKAIGNDSSAGGIDNIIGAELALYNTRVVANLATNEPGGIRNLLAPDVSVDDDSTITKNRPTNCSGDVENCFG